VKDCHVLIISASLLFADAISRLLEREGVTIVAQASNLPEARQLLIEHQIDAIVVDHDNSQLRDAEVVPHLFDDRQQYHVLFLTMTNNEMIVYHRERVKNVTPTDLVKALYSNKLDKVTQTNSQSGQLKIE